MNLARWIRADHPLCKLRATIKLEVGREKVAASYGRKGNVSVDPVIDEDDAAVFFGTTCAVSES